MGGPTTTRGEGPDHDSTDASWQPPPGLPAPRPLRSLSEAERATLITRASSDDPETEAVARDIVEDVRRRGDAALREHTKRLDGVESSTLMLGPAEFSTALERIDPALRGAMERAARNLRTVAETTRPATTTEVDVEPGLRVIEAARPLARVGCYVPGGRAAYPSSVLMTAVPAKAAGVGDVIVATPPGPDGSPPDAVLAACAIAGVDRLLAAGGAQAVAALAFGTESVPQVDKIVGPGNRYVTAAKRLVYGTVDVDAPAGPTEVIILADASADAAWVAMDLVAQAEHGPDSPCILVTTSPVLAEAVAQAIPLVLAAQPRRETAAAALVDHGAILVATDETEACGFVDAYAPEHLQIMTEDPASWAARIRNAPAVFLGHHACVPVGDYLTGANHVLPTMRAGRWASPLSVHTFLVRSVTQTLTSDAAAHLVDDLSVFARSEGLVGHALSFEARSGPMHPLSARLAATKEDDAAHDGVTRPRGGTEAGNG